MSDPCPTLAALLLPYAAFIPVPRRARLWLTENAHRYYAVPACTNFVAGRGTDGMWRAVCECGFVGTATDIAVLDRLHELERGL